jgi:hypothetical protein
LQSFVKKKCVKSSSV